MEANQLQESLLSINLIWKNRTRHSDDAKAKLMHRQWVSPVSSSTLSSRPSFFLYSIVTITSSSTTPCTSLHSSFYSLPTLTSWSPLAKTQASSRPPQNKTSSFCTRGLSRTSVSSVTAGEKIDPSTATTAGNVWENSTTTVLGSGLAWGRKITSNFGYFSLPIPSNLATQASS